MQLRRAFSLVELLLVVTVIVILIGLLQPALIQARREVRSAVCQSNLHQLGVAVHQYSTDWAGKLFPYAKNGTYPNYNLYYEAFWMTLVEVYHPDLDEIRMCPETVLKAELQTYSAGWGTVKAAWGAPWTGNWGFVGKNYGSYAWNSWMHSGRNYLISTDPNVDKADDLLHWKSLKRATYPHETPFFTDAMWVDTWFQNKPGGSVSPPPPHLQGYNSAAGRVCIDRHRKRVNHVFVDLSTRTTELELLWSLRWNTASQPMAPPFALPAE